MKKQPLTILRMAVASPLRRHFDYLPTEHIEIKKLKPGMRFIVPFGHRKIVAVLLLVCHETDVPIAKLKSVVELLDEKPLLSVNLMRLLNWASDYYHHAIGDVMVNAFPKLLRDGEPAKISKISCYQLAADVTDEHIAGLKRAKRQQQLLQLIQAKDSLSSVEINAQGISRTIINALLAKKLLIETQFDIVKSKKTAPSKPLELTGAQANAVAAINEQTAFETFLLDGIAGSGKTEVYLQSIDAVLKRGKQALVLVPEIGLTPQTIARFETRFQETVVAFHSGLNHRERLNAWLLAEKGKAKIVIGTRSAIFTPLKSLGIIILDEEHDQSFKQQSGFRYSARDLAIVRGQMQNVPVVLGTATPSLESIANVQRKRFTRLVLPKRAGVAIEPSFHLIDLRGKKCYEGLSDKLIAAITQHLQASNQVLLFLNRRGFSPILMCHQCGFVAECRRCDAKLTVHQSPGRLICHHCGSQRSLMKQCPDCHGDQLSSMGIGTERMEQTLQQQFSSTNIVRIDRDSTRRKGSMQKLLKKIHDGEPSILIGTQMLAKGHHFPNVTLVAIINTDSGLFSADFRSTERMAQLIVQVAGRAGRAEKPGEVYLQTYNPEHPLLLRLIHQGYHDFAKALLAERENAMLPPFSYHALLRAEANAKQTPYDFLQSVREETERLGQQRLQVFGPIPSLLERKAGKYRAQLLIQAKQRVDLQELLKPITKKIEENKLSNKVRWSLDVDPLEVV